MINVKILSKPKNSGSSSSGTSSNVSTSAASYGTGVAKEAKHAVNADLAEEASKLTSDSSDWTTIANKIATAINALADVYLSKQDADSAAGVITFLKGILFGEDGTYGITEEGIATLKDLIVKNLTVTGAAHFFELIIDKVSAAGGQAVWSAAKMTVARVDEVTDDDGNVTGWKLWQRTKDSDGNQIADTWRVGDQALSMTNNLCSGTSYDASNRYWWRKVTAVGGPYDEDESTPLTFEDPSSGESVEGQYIIVDATAAADNSGTPQIGDKVVLLGHQGTSASDYAQRQNAVMICAYNGLDSDLTAPYFVQYSGINDFSLGKDKALSYLAGNGNYVAGELVVIASDGSTSNLSTLAVTANSISAKIGSTAVRNNLIYRSLIGGSPESVSRKIYLEKDQRYIFTANVTCEAIISTDEDITIASGQTFTWEQDTGFYWLEVDAESLEWIQLEKGSIATAWSWSEEDYTMALNNIVSDYTIAGATQGTGTFEVITDEYYGKVLQVTYDNASDLQLSWAYNSDRLTDLSEGDEVSFFVVAKPVSGDDASWGFGGNSETLDKLMATTCSKRQLVNGWYIYYTDFTVGENGIFNSDDAAFWLANMKGTWQIACVGAVKNGVPPIDVILQRKNELDTGIDVERNKITLTANTTEFRNNQGELLTVIDNQGLTSYRVNCINTATGVVVYTINEYNDGLVRRYYPDTGNILSAESFAYDDDGNCIGIVTTYYNNDDDHTVSYIVDQSGTVLSSYSGWSSEQVYYTKDTTAQSQTADTLTANGWLNTYTSNAAGTSGYNGFCVISSPNPLKSTDAVGDQTGFTGCIYSLDVYQKVSPSTGGSESSSLVTGSSYYRTYRRYEDGKLVQSGIITCS